MTTLFVISAVVLGWTWIGFPAFSWFLARVRPQPVRSEPGFVSAVSVIIVARDEQEHLADKLASVRRGGIAADKLEIIVVDDGSTDATSIIAAAEGARVIVLSGPRGKARALVSAARRAKHGILVFTDARQPLEEGALAPLVAPFADSSVDAVGGEIVDGAVGAGGVYRKLDDALRRWEAASGSAVGVTGALWACRSVLFPPIPSGLVLDDLYAPLEIARAGGRVVIAPDARVHERAEATTPEAERRRRVRTLAGNFQLVWHAPWLLAPTMNPLFFRFVSHKVFRLFGPLALAGLTISLAALGLEGGTWALLGVLALCGFIVAALGARAGALGRVARSFVAAQGLVLIALVHALRGTTPWRPAAVGVPPAAPLGKAEVSHGH